MEPGEPKSAAMFQRSKFFQLPADLRNRLYDLPLYHEERPYFRRSRSRKRKPFFFAPRYNDDPEFNDHTVLKHQERRNSTPAHCRPRKPPPEDRLLKLAFLFCRPPHIVRFGLFLLPAPSEAIP
ncbi:hypothetical protein PSPO01_09371 [Paraphaeosphaeria sporulosa]